LFCQLSEELTNWVNGAFGGKTTETGMGEGEEERGVELKLIS
jgi:hypothetical protein